MYVFHMQGLLLKNIKIKSLIIHIGYNNYYHYVFSVCQNYKLTSQSFTIPHHSFGKEIICVKPSADGTLTQLSTNVTNSTVIIKESGHPSQTWSGKSPLEKQCTVNTLKDYRQTDRRKPYRNIKKLDHVVRKTSTKSVPFLPVLIYSMSW